MAGQKRRSMANVLALLNRYQCPTLYHAVRARFMGSIVSLSRIDRQSISSRNSGVENFHHLTAMDDLNHLLHVLMDGLWNRLTAHQRAGNPFRLTRVQVRQIREGVHHYALVRKQEIESFVDGLFGPHEEVDLPESARDGVQVLAEIRAMLAGTISLLGGHCVNPFPCRREAAVYAMGFAMSPASLSESAKSLSIQR
jgi:hypothetical protein